MGEECMRQRIKKRRERMRGYEEKIDKEKTTLRRREKRRQGKQREV